MEFTGKTVDETIAAGLKEMNLSEENAVVTVKEEPTRGLFGKIKGQAVVEITEKLAEKPVEKTEKAAKAEKNAAPISDGVKEKLSEEKMANAVNFVQKTLELMGLNATACEADERENSTIVVESEASSEIIGYRGEVLDALQTLAGAVANIGEKEYKKVVVDCENYRGRREDTLVKLAHKLEEKAVEMRREVILESMIPYERRIIHTALSNSETVTTRSEGKEPNRYVVIVPNDKDEFSRPYNAGRNSDRGGRPHGGRSFGGDRGGRNYGDGERRERGGRSFGGDRGGRNNRGFGGRSGGRSGSGFGEEKRKPSSGFGTFLGNSFKDKD